MTFTAKPDYWSLLGISPGSDQDQLKRAFRREARKWHPDLNVNNKDAEERFKLVNEAYAVLSDPRKRSLWEDSNDYKYDISFKYSFPTFKEYLEVVLGEELLEEQEEVRDDNLDEFNPDIKSNKFNRPTHSSPPPPPVQIYEDIESIVELTPEEALYGAIVQLELEDETVVEIETPKMAGDGWRLRLPNVAMGGRDHFVQLKVQTSEGLRIDGMRVLYKLELFPPDAVLGCAVNVPTLSGQVTLQVPPQSSSGRLLRLRGRGIELDGLVGDQLVEIVVVIPDDIRDDERALYERLQQLSLEAD